MCHQAKATDSVACKMLSSQDDCGTLACEQFIVDCSTAPSRGGQILLSSQLCILILNTFMLLNPQDPGETAHTLRDRRCSEQVVEAG